MGWRTCSSQYGKVLETASLRFAFKSKRLPTETGKNFSIYFCFCFSGYSLVDMDDTQQKTQTMRLFFLFLVQRVAYSCGGWCKNLVVASLAKFWAQLEANRRGKGQTRMAGSLTRRIDVRMDLEKKKGSWMRSFNYNRISRRWRDASLGSGRRSVRRQGRSNVYKEKVNETLVP